MIAFFDEEEIGFILEHEFYHVKHRDLLRKLLVLFLNCLNWFNPLYYLLMKNLSEWTEAACDEDVTKKYTKGQKRKYCELIIKVLELEQVRSKGTFFSIGFVGLEIKNYKWRMIKNMKKCNMNSRLGKVTVATMAMVAMFCGNASAKELDVPVNMLFSKNVEFVKAGELEEVAADDIQMEGEFESHTHINKDSLVEFELCNTDDITYEIIYQREVADVPEQVQAQVEPRHAHKLVDITLKEHKKKSNGSCVTTYYEGQKCSTCGTIWKGDVIRTVTDAKCTH